MTSGMERLPRQLCRFVDHEELIARVRAKLSAGYDRAQGALRSSEEPNAPVHHQTQNRRRSLILIEASSQLVRRAARGLRQDDGLF